MFLFLTQTENSLLDTQTLFKATIQPQQILVSKPGCVRLQDRNVTCSTRRCGEQGAGQNLDTCVLDSQSLRGFLCVFQGYWLRTFISQQMDFVASSAALRVVEQPSEIKGTCSSAVLTFWFLFTVNCCFCLSVLLLAAGLHAGLDQTGFSVNDSWQIQDDGNPRDPLQSPDETE